jgi:hypothetical protein
MKVFTIGSSALACILPLVALAIALPASAAGAAPICKGLAADKIKAMSAPFVWDASTPHELIPHGPMNLLGYDTTDADVCARMRFELPARLDERRIIGLDPHKCGVTDFYIQLIDRVIAEYKDSDCIRGDPRFKMTKIGKRADAPAWADVP